MGRRPLPGALIHIAYAIGPYVLGPLVTLSVEITYGKFVVEFALYIQVAFGKVFLGKIDMCGSSAPSSILDHPIGVKVRQVHVIGVHLDVEP